MQTIKIFATALAAGMLFLSGCASLPSPQEMKAEIVGFQLPKVPGPDQAMVYVVRPSGLGTLIRFNVFLDDQEAASEVGYTRGSQYIYFPVKPGKHRIYSKAENWAETMVTANAGDVIFIQQEPSMGILMARNTIYKLEDYKGKYHVKTLSLGTLLSTSAQAAGSPGAPSAPAQPAAASVSPASSTPASGSASPAAASTASSGYADLNDTAKLDQFGVRQGYETFLKNPLPRAFAFTADGHWWTTAGLRPVNPESSPQPHLRVVPDCERHYKKPCTLYAVDNNVVYKPAAPQVQ